MSPVIKNARGYQSCKTEVPNTQRKEEERLGRLQHGGVPASPAERGGRRGNDEQKGVVTAPGWSPGMAGREEGRGGRANGPGVGLAGCAARPRLASLRICRPDCLGAPGTRASPGPGTWGHKDRSEDEAGTTRGERHGPRPAAWPAALPVPEQQGAAAQRPRAPGADPDSEEPGPGAPSLRWTAPVGLHGLRAGAAGSPAPAASARLPGSTDAWASPEWSARPANRGAGAGSGPLDIGSSYSPCLAPPVRCPR